jgi:hypothetical protein
VVFPLFHRGAMKNSPFRALGEDKRFRSLRRATKGSAFEIRKFFGKNLTKNFFYGESMEKRLFFFSFPPFQAPKVVL